MPHVSKMYASTFLKASDLLVGDDYSELEMTIASVGQQEMPNDGSRKWVAHFKEQEKGLVLNTTNIHKLEDLCGSHTDHWTGKRVRLYAAPVSFRGEEMMAVRIKAAKPAANLTAAQDEIPF